MCVSTLATHNKHTSKLNRNWNNCVSGSQISFCRSSDLSIGIDTMSSFRYIILLTLLTWPTRTNKKEKEEKKNNNKCATCDAHSWHKKRNTKETLSSHARKSNWERSMRLFRRKRLKMRHVRQWCASNALDTHKSSLISHWSQARARAPCVFRCCILTWTGIHTHHTWLRRLRKLLYFSLLISVTENA